MRNRGGVEQRKVGAGRAQGTAGIDIGSLTLGKLEWQPDTVQRLLLTDATSQKRPPPFWQAGVARRSPLCYITLYETLYSLTSQ